VRLGLKVPKPPLLSNERIKLLAMLAFLVFTTATFLYYAITLSFRPFRAVVQDFKSNWMERTFPHDKPPSDAGITSLLNDMEASMLHLKEHLKKSEKENLALASKLGVTQFEKNQVTGIPEYNAFTMPKEYQLHQNFPNPFNPSTQIAFTMPHATDVRLVVYDLLGRKVKTVFEGQRTAGLHVFQWDGRNEAGQNVASGVYIYTLTVDGIDISRKMQLIR
jgi:hypothetical protein